MTVRELYRALKAYVDMCPDQEILAVTPEGLREITYVDRSDYGGREIVLGAMRHTIKGVRG